MRPAAPFSPELSFMYPMCERTRNIACRAWLRRPNIAASWPCPCSANGSPIGAITVLAPNPAMFSERQIAMLQTFADQAVIAIENVRLFKELQERLEQSRPRQAKPEGDQCSPTDAARAGRGREARPDCAKLRRTNLPCPRRPALGGGPVRKQVRDVVMGNGS